MSIKRMQRVSELIRETIGDILVKINDPRIGFVTITEVKVTPDLEIAKVYVTTMSEGEKREEVLKGLESAAGYIRKILGKEIRLKKTPRVVFCMDSGLEKGKKVRRILETLHKEEEMEDQDIE
ncbi:MAG: 30S ribosome-binding factor RbfA [Candidatus Eremiobacteraeota bacterium]|nr:30S ribosome-binding factor RbfA [Candidatus Eremiobacteraeota bacterium]